MNKNIYLDILEKNIIVAIIRSDSSYQLLKVIDAIVEGGINAIEITITTPNSLEIINEVIGRYSPDTIFGVGTIIDAESARAAIFSNARFIISPVLDIGVIKVCNRYSVPVIPGCFTPTEILHSWEAGADFVKVFPASVGGPSYIKSIKAPLPQVKLMPVGGVNIDNIGAFIQAGSTLVGVGSSLVNQRLIENKEFKKITELARRFRDEIKKSAEYGKSK